MKLLIRRIIFIYKFLKEVYYRELTIFIRYHQKIFFDNLCNYFQKAFKILSLK